MFKLPFDKKKKDQQKADLCTCLIAFPEPETSSFAYKQAATMQGVPVNFQHYTKNDIPWITINGGYNAIALQFIKCIKEITRAIEQGVETFLADSTEYTRTNGHTHSPCSEQGVLEFLASRGYKEEPFGDGRVARWTKIKVN